MEQSIAVAEQITRFLVHQTTIAKSHPVTALSRLPFHLAQLVGASKIKHVKTICQSHVKTILTVLIRRAGDRFAVP
jgi:hypothetical protein